MSNQSSTDRGDEFIATHGADFVRADSLVEQGKHEEAVAIFIALLAMPSNAYVKAVMWMNIATIRDKMGQADEVLRAFDEAGVLEHSYGGYLAQEHKAYYLAKIGRVKESLVILEMLLRRTDLKQEDRVRVETNVKTLRSR